MATTSKVLTYKEWLALPEVEGVEEVSEVESLNDDVDGEEEEVGEVEVVEEEGRVVVVVEEEEVGGREKKGGRERQSDSHM